MLFGFFRLRSHLLVSVYYLRMKKALTLSIVIPVYNEASRLRACLTLIAAQTLPADEVIVVDNNSTDESVAIAREFAFVRVAKEERKGVLYAARTGLDAATGDIVCRIDADTRLPENWLKLVVQAFEAHPQVAAITGHCYFYDFPFRRGFQAVHHLVYYRLQKLVAGTEILWGSNMAIKKTAWKAVRGSCLWQNGIHEDIDLSLHLQEHGLVVARVPELLADVSLRHGELGPVNIISYLAPWPKTYWSNHRHAQALAIGLMLLLVWVLVPPLSIVVLVAGMLRNFLKYFFA